MAITFMLPNNTTTNRCPHDKYTIVIASVLHPVCCLRQGSAQLCACNDTACQSQTMQNNPTQQQTCCQWVPQPIDTDPQSLNDPNGTPLGFLLAEYRGTDSNLPDYCVRFDYPTPLRNFRYVVVSVSPNL